jgi:hypothetical protein
MRRRCPAGDAHSSPCAAARRSALQQRGTFGSPNLSLASGDSGPKDCWAHSVSALNSSARLTPTATSTCRVHTQPGRPGKIATTISKQPASVCSRDAIGPSPSGSLPLRNYLVGAMLPHRLPSGACRNRWQRSSLGQCRLLSIGPSSTAALALRTASSMRCLRSLSSTTVAAPTLITATPPASFASRLQLLAVVVRVDLLDRRSAVVLSQYCSDRPRCPRRTVPVQRHLIGIS